jgi:hypothetical protein
MLNRRTPAGAIPPLAARPEYRAALAVLQPLEQRLAEAEMTRRRAVARARGDRPTRTALQRAADLVAGGVIDRSPPGNIVSAADEEIVLLRAAIGEASRQLDAVSRDFSWEASNTVKPAFDECMRRALQAMHDLASAFRDAAHVGDGLVKLGYRPSAMLLSDLCPEGAMMLGDPDAVGLSQSWRFKRALEERKII